jgi:glycosyltransferase involved in cell wall biosynthesis
MILGDPPAGLLARPGDADSLADAILELLAQPALGERLRELGRQRLPDYTWQRLASALNSAYTSTSPAP